MAAVWFYLKNGQRQGPVDVGELKVLADSGKLLPEEMVWKEGMAGWEPARSVKGLFEVVKPADPFAAGPVPFTPTPRPPSGSNRGSGVRRPDVADTALPTRGSFFGSAWIMASTMLMSLAALVFAILAFMRGSPPIGHGLRHYDLSSPEATVRSLWQIDANRDLLAKEELTGLHVDPEEALRTLEIKDTLNAPARGMKIVLFSYKRNGKEKHDYWGFAKHATRDMWVKRHVSDFDVESGHPDVARKMRDWRSKEFDPLTQD